MPRRASGAPVAKDSVAFEQKYGIGPNSIHRLEAPRGQPAASTSLGGVLTFRARAGQSNRTLHRMCCASQRLANHRAILLVGCSQLEAIFDHLCKGKESRGLARSDEKQQACQATRTLMVLVMSAGKWAKNYPSFHSPAVALSALPPSVRPTAVVTNFAAAHLLHVHPVRPLFDADDTARPGCYPQSTCADYRGILRFQSGEWMASDAAAYRQALGAQTSLTFMTPNWICDAKLYKQYLRQLAVPTPARYVKCLDWIARRPGTTRPADGGRLICERYTFTSAGSTLLASSILEWGQRLGASLLHANALTRNRCNATIDARHYPSRVPLQVAELLAGLTAARTKG